VGSIRKQPPLEAVTPSSVIPSVSISVISKSFEHCPSTSTICSAMLPLSGMLTL
jgi:hypothetical protein